MFICTFDRNVCKELDKSFKFLHSRLVNNKMMFVYVFDNKMYSKFSRKDKVFIMNKLFF